MDLTPILADAAKRLDCDQPDLEWFAWPEIFPSSSGPRYGVGGQAMTTFQIIAFAHPSQEKAIKFCAGVWKKWDRVIASRW